MPQRCPQPVEQLPRRPCAAGLTDSRASRASRATRGDARAARHSPWHAVQCHCSLVNAAHRTSRLLTRQHIAAPASSGGRGAAAPPPCPVHGAGTRQHGPPPAAGGARLPVEAPDAPSPPAALRSAAHGLRHAKPTLSLPKRLSVEGLAARTRLLRGHALRPGERGAGTQPFLESCVPEGRIFLKKIYSPESAANVILFS